MSWIARALCLLALVASMPVRSREVPLDLYFVAVGNSYYAGGAGNRGLTSIPGLNVGARLVAERLVAGGARFGVTLVSRESAYVTTSDVERALSDVTKRIEHERPSRPILLIYIAAHGVAEGVGWNHFSFPGAFTYRGEIGAGDIEALSKAAIHAATLVDALNKRKISYVLLLDSCSEGKKATFEESILSSMAADGLNSVMAGLRWLNEFRQENPVLFSSEPGTTVLPALDPTNSGPDLVGPLARRMLLASATIPSGGLSVGAIVRDLQDPSLDNETAPAITHATATDWWDAPLLTDQTRGQHEEREGSASTSAEPCC